MVYTEKNYLKHYGVKGMRRGVRRTPRDDAQISGPGTQARYGNDEMENELGYALSRTTSVPGTLKKQWRPRSNVANAKSMTDVNRGMTARNAWRKKDRIVKRKRGSSMDRAFGAGSKSDKMFRK